MKDTIVIDLDGTLANVDHRTHFVRREKPDWDAFYSACDLDSVNEWCSELMGGLANRSYLIRIVSARRRTEEQKTRDWLKNNNIYFDRLELLRAPDDYSPDIVLKKAWLDSYGKDRILFVVDDRQKVVDMWRAEGLICLQCYAWPEFKNG